MKSISEKKSRGHRTSKIVKSNQSYRGPSALSMFILALSARSTHDVAWRGMWICMRSKDAQKQLARTSLSPGQMDSQVKNLGLLATPFGQGFACTCVDLRSFWLRSNLHASHGKFFTVWPPNPSQCKLNDVH